MAWIRIVEPAEADQKLDRAYKEVASARGRVANILKVHSVHPETLSAHFSLFRELMFGHSELSREDREMSAVTVSVANHCHY